MFIDIPNQDDYYDDLFSYNDYEYDFGERELETERVKMWKPYTPFLYDMMMINSLEWPSLTVQWLPETLFVNFGPFIQQKILIGTHTYPGNQNYVMTCKVIMPIIDELLASKNSYNPYECN